MKFLGFEVKTDPPLNPKERRLIRITILIFWFMVASATVLLFIKPR